MIRTHVISCKLPRTRADALNLESGRVYTGVLVAHWRTVRKKNLWLSEKSGTRWSDMRATPTMHAHSIDAAQQGFYKACDTTRELRKAGFTEARFPHWTKKFRTTIWKNTGIKRNGDILELSGGGRAKKEREERKISLPIPMALRDVLRFLEVRLVYDQKVRRYFWHIVVENGKQPKPSPGEDVVSVDLGEIHPAVVGDEAVATVITCRERRAESQGHAKRLAKIQKAASRKRKGSRRHRRLMKAKSRMKAKHDRVMRDMEHKISRAIVDTAVERKAGTIAIGDIREIADGVDCGKVQNGRMSRWNHGKSAITWSTKRQPKGSWSNWSTNTTRARRVPTASIATNRRGASTAARPAGFRRIATWWVRSTSSRCFVMANLGRFPLHPSSSIVSLTI